MQIYPIAETDAVAVEMGTIGNVEQLTVDARALHKALGSRKDFTSWIKSRVSKYDFLKNHDFEVFTQMGENPLGGRPATEYRLSVGMAKELAMIENTPTGRMVRRYFIECERRALAAMQGQPRRAALPDSSGELAALFEKHGPALAKLQKQALRFSEEFERLTRPLVIEAQNRVIDGNLTYIGDLYYCTIGDMGRKVHYAAQEAFEQFKFAERFMLTLNSALRK